MELRHLRYFVAVAEELNFTRAALRVGIGQPPLSQQVRALEKELGVSLFRRLPHGVELTSPGEAFLPEARAVLDQANKAVRTAQRAGRGEYGRLRVGFTGSAAFRQEVPTAIRNFRRTYPDVDLTLEEAPTTDLIERLMTGGLDAAFVRPGQSNPEGLRVHDLGAEAMVTVLPSAHRLAKAASVSVASLADEPLVLFPRSAGPGFFDEIMEACRRAGFEPVLGSVAPQLTSVANLVATGLGVSIVPESVAHVRVHGVRYRKLTGDPPIARLVLLTRLDDQSEVVSNFLSVASPKE